MKDKEKQIEEIVNCEDCIHNNLCSYKEVLRAKKKFKPVLETIEPIELRPCRNYYPKPSEDSVVISKGEYEDLRLLEEKYGKPTYIDGCMTAYAHRLETANNLVSKASKETVEKIIAFIETLRVPEDGRHEWRDHHNDTIDRIILKLNQKFVNGVETKES